jgi:Ca2+-transporting ATPase
LRAKTAGANVAGLSTSDASQRLAQSGPNEIRRAEGTPAWKVLLGQFSGALVWLLIGACALSAILGELGDAIAIGAILVINALVGFKQEYSAEKAVLALRSMTAPRARVLRDGTSVMIPAREVVVGDVLVLEAGDVVAADARLLEASSLRTVEAALTGESAPVNKDPTPLPEDAPLADRHDRVFLGTAVAAGTGQAEVFATGMQTELGKIADLLAETGETQTPLQQRLEHVGGVLLKACGGVVVVVAALRLWQGEKWLSVLMSAVSLAVAAVPEGLAAMVTIALAIGVQRMAKRNVLVRHLPAVETLGSTTVICTDKTGTLTTGTMTVRELWGPDQPALLQTAAACCDAELHEDGTGVGDPTEIAILIVAQAKNIERATIEQSNPRVKVWPFDAATKMMAVLRADGVKSVKGAVEVLIPLAQSGVDGLREAAETMAQKGLRVLAVGRGRGEEKLDLLGLIGMADPPRPEAIRAIADARAAGIRTVMITGDHPATAQAIAREMGLLSEGEDPAAYVHARATSADKLRIVQELKQKGEIVAMTGDGVNDAPALKEAHIGIAMGKTGTEVTREAADMVLSDDNFASIVAAVQEGRGIYDNIRKALVYLLAGNTGELLLMLGAALVGQPVPLLPLQLLWINLVTDGFPALALVMDPTDPDALKRPPRRPDEAMLGRAQWTEIVLTGALQAIVSLAVFAWAMTDRNLDEARNMAFSTLVFGEVLRSLASRSPTRTHFQVGLWTNMRLIAVVVVSVVVQIAIHHLQFTRDLFHLGYLGWDDCALSFGLGMIPVTCIEVAKLVRVAWRKKRGAQ